MIRLILGRLIVFLPTLVVLSWLAFGLNQCSPEDPVTRLLPLEEVRLREDDPTAYERAYQQAAERMGQDLPLFYFGIGHKAAPPEDLDAPLPQQKKWLEDMCLKTGRPDLVASYYQVLRHLANGNQNGISTVAKELLLTTEADRVAAKWAELEAAVKQENPETQTALAPVVAEISDLRSQMEAEPARGNILRPTFSWHGPDNQYHRWLTGILSGDLGVSYINRQPVGQKLGQALKWTALINFLAILLAYGVAVPLGLKLGSRAGSKFDGRVSFFLLLLFSIPAFWTATMISSFFTTPAYGMDWFPSMGVGRIPDGTGWLAILWIRIKHLFLPVLMLAYPSWAYLSRQMRASTLTELGKPYIQTARLKGLSEDQILRKHVLRNALFPIITMLAG
ncbi:MAG: ABC transporter permease, partial [Bacteroidota bacterium]